MNKPIMLFVDDEEQLAEVLAQDTEGTRYEAVSIKNPGDFVTLCVDRALRINNRTIRATDVAGIVLDLDFSKAGDQEVAVRRLQEDARIHGSKRYLPDTYVDNGLLGMYLLAYIRSRVDAPFFSVPVVLATTNPDPVHQKFAFRLGCSGFHVLGGNQAHGGVSALTQVGDLSVAHLSRLAPGALALAEMLDGKDPYSCNHSRNVADLAVLTYDAIRDLSVGKGWWENWATTTALLRLAKALGMDRECFRTLLSVYDVGRDELAKASAIRERTLLYAAALCHDIGKIAVPEGVLNKPSGLTAAERVSMEHHAEAGAKVLDALTQDEEVIAAVRYLHLSYSGVVGYPLAGSGRGRGILTPDEVREHCTAPDPRLRFRDILAIADTYDAMRDVRVYKPAKAFRLTLLEILRCSMEERIDAGAIGRIPDGGAARGKPPTDHVNGLIKTGRLFNPAVALVFATAILVRKACPERLVYEAGFGTCACESTSLANELAGLADTLEKEIELRQHISTDRTHADLVKTVQTLRASYLKHEVDPVGPCTCRERCPTRLS